MSSALKERDLIDRFGYDARVSNFQLLLKEIARNAKSGLELRKLSMAGNKGHSVIASKNYSSRCK